MHTVTMAQFTEYVLTSGTSRLTEVERIKRGSQGLDEQAQDFYRPVRAAIRDMHEMGLDTIVLDDLLASLVDKREQLIFLKVVNGYKKFLQQGKMTWFEPPMRDYPIASLDIRVAPELGLTIDGRPHAIKLYFRGEPIDPQRVLITNQLLANAFSTVWPGVVFSTLDVRRARLHSHQPRGNVRLLLQAEAMSMGCILEST